MPIMLAGTFHGTINPETYQKVQQYRLQSHQHVVTARNKTNPKEMVALRLRLGREGYSQWLNELYVYLLPNFKHKNILPFLGYDKRLLDESKHNIFNSKILDHDEDEDYDADNDSLRYLDYDDDNHRDNSNHDDNQDSTQQHDQQQDQQQVSSSSTVANANKQRPTTSSKSKENAQRTKRATLEYWVVNSYTDCITLRHYLMMHTLTWAEMITMAHGVMCGVHYLHDNAEYTCNSRADTIRSVDGFIRSTNGALKKAVFQDSSRILHLKPPLTITIIHRNLNSLNIVLGPGCVPKIWNFGYAFVYHPFQPINFDHYVDEPIKEVHMTSPYSPPEVLSERTYFTHEALKSHDLYSCGILLYELLTRCVLPKVEGALPGGNLERADPTPYAEPFAREFSFNGGGNCGNGGGASSKLMRQMLYQAVCKHRARPTLRPCWLLGRKSHRFVQLIRELWDHDYEARLHCCTVIDRLERTSLRNQDRLNKYPSATDRVFDYKTMWPPDDECHQAPLGPLAKQFNLVFEPLEDLDILAARGRERQRVSSSTSASESGALYQVE